MDYNNSPNNYQQNYDLNNKQPANGLAIASMILGIVSILISWCYGVGIIFGIVSIVLGVISRKSSNGKFSGMALAGLICSIIGIILGIAMLVMIIFAFTMVSDMSQSGGYDNIYDYINSLENYN